MFCPDAVVWGTVGEWVAGIGALAAVIVALILFGAEKREKDKSQEALRDRENRDRETARTQQARQVFVWKVYDTDGSGMGEGVAMHNGSDLPIFDVSIIGYARGNGASALDSPDDWKEVVRSQSGFGEPSYGMMREEVWVLFTDALGTTWARNGQGTLVENPDRDALRESRGPEGPTGASVAQTGLPPSDAPERGGQAS